MHSLEYYTSAFEMLDDWDQRYEYLVELGEQLPLMEDHLKTESNRVKACMSKVWIDVKVSDQGIVDIKGDCDTSVIKGVLALIINLCNGLTTRQLQALNLDDIFESLRLHDHLSPNRHVGVYAMFDLLKTKAEQESRLAVA